MASKKTVTNRPPLRNRAGLAYTLFSAAVISLGTYLAIRWAQGDYRFDQSEEMLSRQTGLLHATSTPTDAEVYIDGKLTSVTDNIIYLSPGEYDVTISKDGYNAWYKKIHIERGLVAQINVTLFPYSPSITSITYTGVHHPLASPDGSKILFYVRDASAKNKNGLYVLDVTNLNRSPQQICDDDRDYHLDDATVTWSPDSNEVLVVTDSKILELNTNRFVNLQAAPDVSLRLESIFDSWEDDLAARETKFTEKIPLTALDTIREHSQDMFLSPDKTKILYVATSEATIPENLIAALPAPNSQPETRRLEPNNLYVYDSYEDRNYWLASIEASSSAKMLLTTPVPASTIPFSKADPIVNHTTLQTDDLKQTLQNFANYYGSTLTSPWTWMPDSSHLVSGHNGQITITSYDGSNPTVVYSGPFTDNFVLPAPSGNKIIILTSFNPDTPTNLYAVELNK